MSQPELHHNDTRRTRRRRSRMTAQLAAALVLTAGSILLLAGGASAQQPMPRIGLPERPVGEPFDVSSSTVGVPVDTACQDGEQIRFTFVAEGEHSSISVSDSDSTFTVWEAGPLGLEPIAQFCDSGTNDTPISVGGHDGRAFTTVPGERYWVSTWFDDESESVTIASPVNDPTQAPVLSYNEPDVIDVQYLVGYGTAGIPQECGIDRQYPVYRQFVATSDLTRVIVSGSEVDLSVTSAEDGTLACLAPPDFEFLTDQRIETLLGADVPGAVALRLDSTKVLNTTPGRTYYLGWIAEDRYESVVVTDIASVGDLPTLSYGIVDVIREIEPSGIVDAARPCLDSPQLRRTFVATADVTRLTVTDDEVNVQVWNANDGGPAHCSRSWGSLTASQRSALADDIDFSEVVGIFPLTADDFDETMTFDTVPGEEYLVAWTSEDPVEAVVITESADPSEVSVTVTCLAGNGRVDVNVFNPGPAAADYDMTVGNLERSVRVGPRERGRVSISGRPEGDLPVTVTRNSEGKATFDPTVKCDQEEKFVTGPEVRVVNACQNGLGFVFFQFANDRPVAMSYIIQFEGVANRSTTAQPHGAAVRGVSGRPSGVYNVRILAANSLLPVYEGAIEVNC